MELYKDFSLWVLRSGKENNITPLSLNKDQVLLEKDVTDDCIYLVTIIWSMICSMKNKKSSSVIYTDFLSRRYHRNLNRL
jgi:hypothetical protein